MDQNHSHLKPWPMGRLLFIAAAVVNAALFAQTTSGPRTAVDLAAPMLKANADRPLHNPPGAPLAETLADGRAIAASKGLPWTGMTYVVFDEPGNLGDFRVTTVLQLYQKRACQADVIAVGRVAFSAYHLSAFGTAVYGDYIFLIDALLKDNRASSIRSQPDIVVTRPGGSLSLPGGHVNFEFQAFPRLQSGATYLQFFRHIPESSTYEALDSSSTLVATGSNWVIARKALSGLAIPGFTRGELETSIGNWLTSCN